MLSNVRSMMKPWNDSTIFRGSGVLTAHAIEFGLCRKKYFTCMYFYLLYWSALLKCSVFKWHLHFYCETQNLLSFLYSSN